MAKRRKLLRILVGLMLVVLALGLVGRAVLHTQRFHLWVLAQIDEKASQEIGGRVKVGDFEFRWSGSRLDFEAVVLRGSEPASRPPLLEVGHLMTELKIISLWRHQVEFNEIVIDRPSLNVSVDAQGHSNLPQGPPSTPGAPPTNLFDLGINHLVINQGELNYNDQHIPLEGDLHDLHAQVSFDRSPAQYAGDLGYREGNIHFGTFSPVATGLEARFVARPAGLSLDSLVLNAGPSSVSLQAQLHGYTQPTVDGSYQAALSAGQLGQILQAASFPAGDVNLQGTLHYQNRSDHPWLENLATCGQVSSPALALTLPEARTSVRALRGNYTLQQGTLEVRKVSAQILGGSVAGALTLTHLTDQPVGRVTAAVKDISLEAASAALNQRELQRAAVSGTVTGTVEGSWKGAGENLELQADAGIAASAPTAGQACDAHEAGRSAASPLAMRKGCEAEKNIFAVAAVSDRRHPKSTISAVSDRRHSESTTSAAGDRRYNPDTRFLRTFAAFPHREGQSPLESSASRPASVQGAVAAESKVIPLHGEVHVKYDGNSGTVALNHTNLATPHSSLELNGTTGRQSSLEIVAHSDDLREVDQLVLIARHATASKLTSASSVATPLGIAGSATFNGQLRGALADLHLTGHLSSSDLEYRGTALSELGVNIALSPSSAGVTQGELRLRNGGEAQFDADSTLANWSWSAQSPMKIDITAAKLSVATLEAVANLHYPVTGVLGVHVAMHGSAANPTGQGSATLAQATAWEQPIQNLNVQMQGAGQTVAARLQISTPAGAGSGKLTYNFGTQAYDAQFHVPALQLERLKAVQDKNAPITGAVSATLAGRGTVHEPELTATVEAPKLSIGRQTLDGLKLTAGVAHQQATFSLTTAAQGAAIEAQGTAALRGNYLADAKLDVRHIQLGAVLAAFAPQLPAGLQGQAEIHASLHGPLKQREQLEAEVEVPTFNLAYQKLQIGNAAPIRAIYRGGVLSLESCELKGTDTDLQLHATVPLAGAAGQLQAAATGQVDLHLMQLFNPDWDTAGDLRLNLNAGGTFSHPAIQGTARLEQVAIETPSVPLGVQKLNAVFAVSNDRIDIQQFNGEAGGGTITAGGFATYRPQVQFNVAVTANKVRLRYPVGTRAILDSRLTLTGSPSDSLLTGSVLIDRLSLTPDFDLATFADQFNGSAAATAGPALAENMKLNVALRSSREMTLASSVVSVQGSANLMVRGTAAEPVILGRTDITGGDIIFNGNRYLVESGVVQFINPVETEPMLNVVVTTTIDQFNLRLNFVGPMDRLRTTYTSDPPLAPIDIINLLATGQTTEAPSTGSTNPESVIAGQLASQFSSRVEKLAGITSLTIDPQVGGAQANGVGRLAVQQRVTKNLFFTFSTDLTTSTGDIVQVEYQATKRFALSTIRDQNGGYTVEIKVHKRF